jgi:hypothetical protein
MILWNARHFGRTSWRLAVALSLFCCALAFTSGCKSGSTEAKAAAGQYYDRVGTHCGDRYLTYAWGGSLFNLTMASVSGYNGRGLVEDNGSSVGVIENALSDADKLNGIEWQGMMYMQGATERQWSGNGWGLYQDTSNHSQVTAIPMMKSKGTWYYRGQSGSNLTLNQVPSPPQIDCAKYAK